MILVLVKLFTVVALLKVLWKTVLKVVGTVLWPMVNMTLVLTAQKRVTKGIRTLVTDVTCWTFFTSISLVSRVAKSFI